MAEQLSFLFSVNVIAGLFPAFQIVYLFVQIELVLFVFDKYCVVIAVGNLTNLRKHIFRATSLFLSKQNARIREKIEVR
jgi:hypothetical protein